MTASPAQLRLNIDGATAMIPRGIGGKGRLGGHTVVYLARPDDGTGVLVVLAEDQRSAQLWRGSSRVEGAADGPYLAPGVVFTTEQATAALDRQLKRMDATPAVEEGVLRGQWVGVLRMTADHRPIVRLERALTSYLTLVVESVPGTEKWSWSLVAKEGKWFVQGGEQASARTFLLSEAIEDAYKRANSKVGEACTTRDTVRRQAKDVDYAAKHPPKAKAGKAPAEKLTAVALPKGRGAKAKAAVQAEGDALKAEAAAIDTAPAKGTALKRARALVARAAVLVEHETCQHSDQKASAQAALDRARKALADAEASKGATSLHTVAQAVALAAARAAKGCAGQDKPAAKAAPALKVLAMGTYTVKAGETLQGQVTAVHMDGVGDGYVREALENGVEVLQVLAAEGVYGKLAPAIRGNDPKRRPVRKAPKAFTEAWAKKALKVPKAPKEKPPKAEKPVAAPTERKAPKPRTQKPAASSQSALPFTAEDRAQVTNTLVAALNQMPASVLKAA